MGLALPHSSLLLTALASLPPPRDGHVSLQEYMAFMISRETENVKSSEEIESAFRALSSEGKPYVTKEELYQVWTSASAPALGRGLVTEPHLGSSLLGAGVSCPRT